MVRLVTGGPTTRYAAPTVARRSQTVGDWIASPRRVGCSAPTVCAPVPTAAIYIAQVTGSQISALDLGTGERRDRQRQGRRHRRPRRHRLRLPRQPRRHRGDGRPGQPARRRRAPPACCATTSRRPTASRSTADRLFIGECREGGRLMEFDLAGGPPRILLENVPSPNAMEVGPDGLLYFPVMGANEIWRIDPDAAARPRPSRPASASPTRSSSTPRASSSRRRWPADRCCASTRAPATRPCSPS